MAPIVTAESIDMSLAFRQSRYDRDSDLGQDAGDYINCPLNRDEYEAFVEAVVAAPRIQLKEFEKELERYFEGCMPIEVLAGTRYQRAGLWPDASCRANRPANRKATTCRSTVAPG